jgi:hypothetical protein
MERVTVDFGSSEISVSVDEKKRKEKSKDLYRRPEREMVSCFDVM